MKKIIGLLVISTLLISCTDNTETNTQESTVIIEDNIENKVNTGVVDEEDKTIESPESVDKKEKSENQNTETEKEASTEKNNNEEVLESEVNDLLDEFIDSLDNYDK